MPNRLPARPRPLLFAAALLALLAAPSARAQEPARTLAEWTDDVKLDGGGTARWRFVVSYDPASGETVRTVTDDAGRLVSRRVTTTALTAPTEAEVARARALIGAEPALAALIARAERPAVEGGFVLAREPGHPCGPGSRCLQFDVMDQRAGRTERVRFVVVDLRTGRVLDADFEPSAEGANMANPAADRSY